MSWRNERNSAKFQLLSGFWDIMEGRARTLLKQRSMHYVQRIVTVLVLVGLEKRTCFTEWKKSIHHPHCTFLPLLFVVAGPLMETNHIRQC